MAKSKGKKRRLPPAKDRGGMTRQQFLRFLEDPLKKKRKKKSGKKDWSGLFESLTPRDAPVPRSLKKSVPFPSWFFMEPPEVYPDPVYRPPGGWSIEHMRRAQEPRHPWMGSPSLNEHLAHPLVEPARGV